MSKNVKTQTPQSGIGPRRGNMVAETEYAKDISWTLKRIGLYFVKEKKLIFGMLTAVLGGTLAGIYAPMLQSNAVDIIAGQRNGDLKIEGEITAYTQRNKSVSAEGYAAQTELAMTVNVRFTNNKDHHQDFERQFTATQSYETTQSLAAVQQQLVQQMIDDLVDQIFNATVANW